MKYMITWSISPGFHKPAAEGFLNSGAPVPDGLKTIGRWHAPGSGYGWHLIEGDDPTALAQHMAQWADLLELQITPVVEDDAAASGLGKVYGS
ncbi:MAG: DUF3303 family protein [Phycisphaerales bacterium]|nr:DUF3303 domain-containing protein [Phycisphaerae bacterium]NNF42020.1 DUF3303 family protein [Phycisphaerales bacterium]NNM25123.1 DUF3303 family protein [Phycisphaerales bacterium]RZV98211.1 MAG: DUF3303 domain-containing protein [Paracoccaceae bacterium]